MISLDVLFPKEVAEKIASKVKARRLELNLTQEGLSKRAGVKLPTYRKFERTGEISFKALLNIAFALNCLQDFELLFTQRQYNSIEEVINEGKIKRKRGKLN